ncbi:hypothetical protein K505DRAFT_220508, partial [Melanomma pulvis-pyrius CBS 109.77]
LHLTLLALVISNIIWTIYTLYIIHDTTPQVPPSPTLSTSYSLDTSSKALHWDTPYSAANKTQTNTLWKSLFPLGQGLVAIPNAVATSLHLPASIAFPAKLSTSTYFVAAYHQIHCLSVIRAALYHFAEGTPQTVPMMHTLHCLDSLRQEVMCHADGTLLYTEDGKVFGDGQVRECGDWEGLREWTVEN